MEDVPGDLLLEIFERLGEFTEVIRCSSVCKEWLELTREVKNMECRLDTWWVKFTGLDIRRSAIERSIGAILAKSQRIKSFRLYSTGKLLPSGALDHFLTYDSLEMLSQLVLETDLSGQSLVNVWTLDLSKLRLERWTYFVPAVVQVFTNQVPVFTSLSKLRLDRVERLNDASLSWLLRSLEQLVSLTIHLLPQLVNPVIASPTIKKLSIRELNVENLRIRCSTLETVSLDTTCKIVSFKCIRSAFNVKINRPVKLEVEDEPNLRLKCVDVRTSGFRRHDLIGFLMSLEELVSMGYSVLKLDSIKLFIEEETFKKPSTVIFPQGTVEGNMRSIFPRAKLENDS